MNEIECPYCEYSYDLCHDDGAFYDESEPTVEECPECEKKFLVNSQMDWTFTAEVAHCLNDGAHNWVKKYNEKHYPELIKREICKECTEERTLN